MNAVATPPNARATHELVFFALLRLMNSDKGIAQARDDTLLLAVADEEADPVVRDQAAAVLQARLAVLAAMPTYPNGAPVYSTTTFKDNGQPIMLDPDGKRSVFCDLCDDEGSPA